MSQRQVTGCDDLRKVTAIELTVDTHDRTISALGEILPNLEQLRLSNSSISSIRLVVGLFHRDLLFSTET